MRGLVNFRDMGGLKTSDGRMVKYKRLLRAGELVKLPAEDILELKQQHDLKIIVDFRSEGEVERYPDDSIDGVEYKNIFLHQSSGQAAVPPSQKEFRKLRDSLQVIDFMINVYDRLATNPFTLGALSRFLEVVKENTEGAVLFHCYAGKDRTGVAAALIYSILGVEEEDIFREYMLTNTFRREANELLLQQAKDEGADEEYLQALKVSYEVVPEYLKHVFDVAKEHSGSMLEYIKVKMGITKDDIIKMRENYLE